MLQGIPMGVLTHYQGALNTWSFTILKSYSYFIDFRKCIKYPLHFFFLYWELRIWNFRYNHCICCNYNDCMI